MATYDYTNKLVIFPNDNDGVAVLYPAPNCGLSLEEIIAKDVPAGKPYQIVDSSEVPADHTYFDAWKFLPEEN